MAGDLASFTGKRFLNLETYRKNGEPVRTPLLFAEDGGRLYSMTREGSGKTKRLRRNPRARVAPCDMRGNPGGEWMGAEARVLTGEEAKRAVGRIARKYRVMAAVMGLVYAVRGWTRAGIEFQVKNV